MKYRSDSFERDGKRSRFPDRGEKDFENRPNNFNNTIENKFESFGGRSSNRGDDRWDDNSRGRFGGSRGGVDDGGFRNSNRDGGGSGAGSFEDSRGSGGPRSGGGKSKFVFPELRC